MLREFPSNQIYKPSDTAKRWTPVPHCENYVPPVNRKYHPAKVCVITDDRLFDEYPMEDDELTDDSLNLYEDKYSKVTSNNFWIKNYFFPSCKWKRLKIDAIKSVEIVAGDAPKWGVDHFRKIWWSNDVLRNEDIKRIKIGYIVIDTNDNIKRGLTIKKLDEFLDVLAKIGIRIINDCLTEKWV